MSLKKPLNSKKRNYLPVTEHYNYFVEQMDYNLKRADGETQQESMERLFKLEDRFKRLLLETEKGRGMYEELVTYIMDTCKNI